MIKIKSAIATAFLIKMFIRKEIIPDNDYLKESYRRLTAEKKSYKDKYINIPVKEYRYG